LIAADDRTGALEVAAELAELGSPVMVASSPDQLPHGGVVDLGSRHLSPDAAARLAGGLDVGAGWTAHKIDSMLRGNWMVELAARSAALGRSVVMVPAWPQMGRTCVDGVVHVHGVALVDARALVQGLGWEVLDVADEVALQAVAAQVAAMGDDVLMAGPAGAVGAVGRARRGGVARSAEVPDRPGPALVVCGSATEVSHLQLAALRTERPAVEVIAAEPASAELRPDVAHMVVERARHRIAQLRPGTIVVIGGETAAGLLGDEPRLVGGTVLPGLPWSRDARGGGPLVISKAGGFGHPRTLIDLLQEDHA
jgi:uncharacterized protein YgbK (DUF1537 family)